MHERKEAENRELAQCYYITARQQLSATSGNADQEKLLLRKVQEAFQAGVDIVQVREKDLPGGRLAEIVEAMQRFPEKRQLKLVVNERLDIAMSCGADGVHLPAEGVPVAAALRKAGKEYLIGVSCHSAKEVARAEAEGASYVLLGPIFKTPSKPCATPRGTELLRECSRTSKVPLFALGGVTRENAAACVSAGATGVAGIRLFQQEKDLNGLIQYVHSL